METKQTLRKYGIVRSKELTPEDVDLILNNINKKTKQIIKAK